MTTVEYLAPSDGDVTTYDCTHLALYAALIDAEDAGCLWQDAARSIMGIDVTAEDAQACWRSHLDRAHWIIGAGLEQALTAFGRRPFGAHGGASR